MSDASGPGFRGYIASRPIMGERTPQHVQNLVVRDYAHRRGLTYLLSATEWAMDECFMVLEEVLGDLSKIDGIIAYSLFMLPRDRIQRQRIWDTILSANKSFHFGLEGLRVATAGDTARIEDIWLARSILPVCPSSPPGFSR